MCQEWELDDLVACWTLLSGDLEQLDDKHAASRLSFAVMLKFFEIEGRFPRHAGEVPPAAVDYVARQLGLPSGAVPPLTVSGRSVQRFRGQIRDLLGFRVFTRGDEDKTIAWLAEQVCPTELSTDRQREAVLARCRAERLEPPGRMDRIIGAANTAADRWFCAMTVSRLSPRVIEALWAIIGCSPADGQLTDRPDGEDTDTPAAPSGVDGPGVPEDGDTFFTELKADPGRLGLETLLGEVSRLGRVRAVGLPEGCSTTCRTSGWRGGGPGRWLSTRPRCGGTTRRR